MFTNGKDYIVQDIDSHLPTGLWKGGKSYENLFSKGTRSGTYDYDEPGGTMTANHLRLSRYEPGVRQSDSSTWTSISDIGESFEDGILTQAEYESVERLYLEAIDRIIADNGSPTFVVSDLHVSPTASSAACEVREGSQVRREDVLEICRMELREELSCRLDHGEDLYVHVGFDLYVYLGCERLTPESVAAIKELGLFIEHGVPSPYSTKTQA